MHVFHSEKKNYYYNIMQIESMKSFCKYNLNFTVRQFSFRPRSSFVVVLICLMSKMYIRSCILKVNKDGWVIASYLYNSVEAIIN